MAALVDSAVDLVSQAVLSLADQYIARHSPEYPVGRSRLEALSVIACAFIMSMASVEGKISHAIVVKVIANMNYSAARFSMGNLRRYPWTLTRDRNHLDPLYYPWYWNWFKIFALDLLFVCQQNDQF